MFSQVKGALQDEDTKGGNRDKKKKKQSKPNTMSLEEFNQRDQGNVGTTCTSAT